jgi:hypothetical protein
MTPPLLRGLDYGPALVVLDAADSAPAELPASWRPLAQRFQIAWCAVPAGARAQSAIEDVVESLADRYAHTHVVARTSVGEAAARVVAEFPDAVRTVMLVGSGRMPEQTGVRTVRIGGSDLGERSVVRDVESVVDTKRTSAGQRVHGVEQVRTV